MKMQLRNSDECFGWIARVMHWTSVALVFFLIVDVIGLDVPPKSSNKAAIVGLHSSLGICLLVLMAMRLTWRVTNPNPLDSYPISPSHRRIAYLIQRLLYLIVIGECLVGMLMIAARNLPILVFDRPLIPAFFRSAELESVATLAHLHLVTGFLLILTLHIGVALGNLVAGPTQH